MVVRVVDDGEGNEIAGNKGKNLKMASIGSASLNYYITIMHHFGIS